MRASVATLAPRPRLIVALAVVALAALLALVLGASLEVTAVMLVMSSAAILLMWFEPPAPAAPAPAGPASGDAALYSPAALRLLDAVAQPLLLVASGRVVQANAAATALLGAHILGRDLRLAIRHPRTEEVLHAPADQLVLLTLDGFGLQGERWELRGAPIGDGARMVQLIDRTAAHAADRMRVDFVANASHELRTPLAAILGFVETLQDEETSSDHEVRRRFLGIIAKEGRRMLRLVEDLLSLSRIEAGRHQAPSARIDLGALAETVAGIVMPQHGSRGGDLEVLRDGDTHVTGDQPELTQLLQNVMSNALKYGTPGTPVTATVAEQADAVTLTVADRGEGIAAEHIPRLTERFYRADPGRSRAVGGTGLGLAIVKHIVERHRGTLEIASRVGHGTTVTVRLPKVAGSGVTKLSRNRTMGRLTE